MLETPVLITIHCRVETTRQVFEAIRQARPRQLLVVGDGARNEAEQAAVADTRALFEQIDWDCELITHYSATNLGMIPRILSGLQWAFEQVESLIILEDDTLPHPDFFPFCADLLAKYRDEPRVMHIGGSCFPASLRGYQLPPSDAPSYVFSRYSHVWGWATWRRAWQHYDPSMTRWQSPADRQLALSRYRFGWERVHFAGLWNYATHPNCNGWDYHWSFACALADSLCVMPTRNLVSNIGFGAEAATTKQISPLANMPTHPLSFPLKHPSTFTIDPQWENQNAAVLVPSTRVRMRRLVQRAIHKGQRTLIGNRI